LVITNPISVEGGSADEWEGTHDGRKVCIKCPRASEEDLRAVTQVRVRYLHAFSTSQEYLWAPQSFLKEAVIWKMLRYQNIAPFIGITRKPLQFVSEYIPNGTLTNYVKKNPGADRISLVSLSPGTTA